MAHPFIMKKQICLLILFFAFQTINASNYYWVNGAGNWSDYGNHWANSSGGSVFHVQPPTPFDSVFFDSNSFTSGDTVFLDTTILNCKNFIVSNIVDTPTFRGIGSYVVIDTYGSFLIQSPAKWSMSSSVNMLSTSQGNTVDISGLGPFMSNNTPGFNFKGIGGSFSLQSDITGLSVNNCTFYSNGFDIWGIDVSISNSTVYLSTSTITCEEWTSSGNQLHADSCVINADEFSNYSTTNFNVVNAGYLSNTVNNSFKIVSVSTITSTSICTFENATIGYRVNSSNCIFKKAIFNGSTVNIGGSGNVYDTLLITNPGSNILLSDSIFVNDSMDIASSASFPTTLHGNNGVIVYNHLFCGDFFYLYSMNGIGGPFFAGDHSVDMGGNTGWIFASCSPVFSNVWPGDANYDLVVDNIDLLYMGVAFGDTGYVRPSASMNFTAQPCQDWFFQFINGTNIKKADSDGNGTIDFPDTTAVSMNYGLTHPFRIAAHNTLNTIGTDLMLQLPGGQLVPGSQVSVPIIFGTMSNVANDVHGLAFTINYDPSKIQSGSLSVDFTSSWIENTNNHLSIVKDFPSAGKCDVAFTRVDHIDVTGQGIIGYLNFTVAANSIGYLNFSFSEILAISHNENVIPVTAGVDSAFTSVNDLSVTNFNIYPNPSSGNTMLYFNNSAHEKIEIQIMNTQGELIYKSFTNENQFLFERNGLSNGIYFISIRNESNEIINQEIVLQ